MTSGLPASNNYRTVSGVSGQAVASVWAVGDAGVAVHDTAGTWMSIPTGQSNALYGVWVAGAGSVYAVGASGTVVYYNGTKWTTMSTPSGTGNLRAIWGNDATHMWAVGDNGSVIFGNGTTWVKQTSSTSQDLTGVWGDAATDVYAVGAGGTIIHLKSSGSWSAMSSGSSNDLAAIGGSSATDIWAVGDNGTTLHYNGTSWSTVGPNSGIPLTGVTAGSSSSIWAVGVQGSLLSSSGSAWQVSMQSGLSFYAVWASSPTDVYVSSLGTMLHFNGTHWTNAYVSDADSMDGVWGGGPQPATVYSISTNGTLATLSGGTWTTQNIGTAVFALWGPNTTGFYTGAGGGLIGYLNNGNLSSYFLTTANVQSIWGSSANNVYAAASDGTIYNEKNTNGDWTQNDHPARDGHAVLALGQLFDGHLRSRSQRDGAAQHRDHHVDRANERYDSHAPGRVGGRAGLGVYGGRVCGRRRGDGAALQRQQMDQHAGTGHLSVPQCLRDLGHEPLRRRGQRGGIARHAMTGRIADAWQHVIARAAGILEMRTGVLTGRRPAQWRAVVVPAIVAGVALVCTTLTGCHNGPTALTDRITVTGFAERGASVTLGFERGGTVVAPASVKWSATPASVVTLTAAGVATFSDTGSVTFTGQDGTTSASLTVHVTAPPMILFDLQDSGGAGNRDVYSVALDGQGLTQLTSGASDGEAPVLANGPIVFTSYRNGYAALYTVRLARGHATRIPTIPSPSNQASVSADGSTLAFISTLNGSDHLGRRGSTGAIRSPRWGVRASRPRWRRVRAGPRRLTRWSW